MDTKQQSPGHETVVLERTTRTGTRTIENPKPIDHRTERPTGHSRTIRVALAAIVLAGATGLLAYRAFDGSPEPIGPADTSHETAEHRRQLSLVPAANVDPHVDQRVAEGARMQRLNGEDWPSPATGHADPVASLADPTPGVSANSVSPAPSECVRLPC